MSSNVSDLSEGVATCTCGELKPGYGHSERCPTLRSLVDANGRPKIAPVQGYIAGIPWSIQLRAYDAYCAKWSSQAALIDLDRRGCRGGFGTEELDEFVPGWRDKVSEITALRKQIAELEAATLSPPASPQGVEGIISAGSKYKTLDEFCEALFTEKDERRLDTLIGEAVTIMQALAALSHPLSGDPI